MLKNERLEQDIKRALNDIITGEVTNTEVKGMLSVTDVKMTPDQKYAKAYISVFGIANKETTINGLNKSSKFIRGALSKRVKIRNTPEITFVLDDSIEYGAYMDKMIDSLKGKQEE